jgi:hypothetical protein
MRLGCAWRRSLVGHADPIHHADLVTRARRLLESPT